MNFEEEAKRIQKKIDWISRQIRETKILLHKQNQEVQEAIKEQEELRKKVNSHSTYTVNGSYQSHLIPKF